MATITNTQLQFASDNISSGNYHFPTGTVSLFFLASAPGEWSQVTTQNNKALRIVSGTGAGTGGTTSFTGCFAAARSVGANFNCTINASDVGSTTLDTNTIASHSHGYDRGGSNPSSNASPRSPTAIHYASGGDTGSYGNGGGHNHPHSASASGSFNATLDFDVQYVDIILCSYSGT